MFGDMPQAPADSAMGGEGGGGEGGGQEVRGVKQQKQLCILSVQSAYRLARHLCSRHCLIEAASEMTICCQAQLSQQDFE
jgi:hypothetical protein